VKLEFWDVSALKKHEELCKYAISKSDCFMICFNQVEFKSFKNVTIIWNELLNDTQRANSILVGTKADLLQDEDIIS